MYKLGASFESMSTLNSVQENCHAMLPQRKPAYSIEELKAIIKRAAS